MILTIRMKIAKLILLILLVASLGVHNTPLQPYYLTSKTPSSNLLSGQTDLMELEQADINFRQLFEGAVNLFQQRQLTTGTENLISYTGDSQVYYGLAGGLAGMGMKLLQAREKYNSIITTDLSTKMLNLAQQIGTTLNSSATTNNSTHFEIPIARGSNLIDLSWDFGLAGQVGYFSKLYNHTQVPQYMEIAQKLLVSINDRSNRTQGVSFKTSLHKEVLSTGWYPAIDYELINENATLNGIALGTAGIAKGSLSFLKQTNSTDKILATNLLHQSLDWLGNEMIQNGTDISFRIASSPINVKSTSYATGASGIADLYLELYQYFNNNTYLEYSTKLYNWLQGTSSGIPRYFYTWENNGTMITHGLEFGVTHGIAGITQFLLKFAKITAYQNVSTSLTELSRYLTAFGSDDGSSVKYGERSISGNTVLLGSTSWAYGTGGIFEVLFDTGNYLNDNQVLSKAYKAKTYLLTQYLEEDGNLAIKTLRSKSLENNPSIGYLGSLTYMYELLPGQLDVLTPSLDFGDVEKFIKTTKSVLLKNRGERDITPTWHSLTGTAFSTVNFSTIIPGGITKQLPISFSPEDESFHTAKLQISYQSISFNVTLTATSFDNPQLTIVEGPQNDTEITTQTPLYFEVQATDTTGIAQVTLDVNGSSQQFSPILGTDHYNLSYSPPQENGTYPFSIVATDVLGHSTTISFQLTVSIYSTPIEARIFGQTTQFILIGLGLITIIAAIVVTRWYMS